jgi:hypothetical protein
METRQSARRISNALLAFGLGISLTVATPTYANDNGVLAPTANRNWTSPSYGGQQNVALIPNVVDVWTQPSIFPGEPLHLRVSSPTPSFVVTIRRETYSGNLLPGVVFTEERTDGIDQRGLVTWEATTATARAAWPITFSISSADWPPGVYTIVTGNGIESQAGRSIFVVKSPAISRSHPLFALSILTYQAYNAWGGASLYTLPRSVKVSLERPYLTWSTTHGWLAEAAWVIWMSKHVIGLQYTTDYDLSLAAPTVNPSALILGQHTEYVSKVFRDWLDRASGDRGIMEIANFGTNALYCQIRFESGLESGSPKEMVAYKFPGQDPIGATQPKEASYFYRSKELARPEGALLGVQYGASNRGLPPTSMKIHSKVPSRFLTGTGLRRGAFLRHLYRQEADFIYPATGVVLLGTAVLSVKGRATRTLATVVRTGKRGARIFSAGSLMWVEGFAGTRPFGISRASFIRFNANILDWLQIKRN